MLSQILIAVTLAGTATAATPAGFEPASTADLIVTFGNTLALNGQLMTKEATAAPPTIGTLQPLTGTYAVLMVDLDVPAAVEGGPTAVLLHWMQQDMIPANTSTAIAGVNVFELRSSVQPTEAIAPYIGPSPPDNAPHTPHRYVQILVDTTDKPNALTSLAQSGASRMPFDPLAAVTAAGVAVVAGNSFNVAPIANSSNDSTATLKPAHITELSSAPQVPAQQGGILADNGAVPSGIPLPPTNGTKTNGTGDVIGGSMSTRGLGENTGGAYFAGFLALAASLCLL